MRSFLHLTTLSTLLLLTTLTLAAPKHLQAKDISNPKKPPGEAWSFSPIGCSFENYYCLVVDKVGYRGWKNLWGTTSKETEDAQTTTAWFNGRISGQAIFICPIGPSMKETARTLVTFEFGQRRDGASVITLDNGPIDCATSDGQSVTGNFGSVTVVVKDLFADAYVGCRF